MAFNFLDDGKVKFQVESFEAGLQAFNSRFAAPLHNSIIYCNSINAGTQERFRFIDVGSGEFAMQAANGKFVKVNLNNGAVLEACADSVQDWEKFNLVKHGDGTLSIRSKATGKLVCSDQNYGRHLIADREKPSAWERFKFVIL